MATGLKMDAGKHEMRTRLVGGQPERFEACVSGTVETADSEQVSSLFEVTLEGIHG